jgi:hypothetical protein
MNDGCKEEGGEEAGQEGRQEEEVITSSHRS